jgi:peptide/nickel transport system permease protein
MAINYPLTDAAAPAVLAPRLTVGEEVVKFVRTKPLGAAGALIILAMMVVAVFAEMLAPYDPYRGDYGLQFARPNAEHWFGTDEFGRDVLSRVVYGARVSLQVGLVSVSLALALGGPLGLVSGYYVGLVDRLAGRLVDVMFAFPSVILIIAISGVVGPSLTTAMLAIGIVYSPIFARIVRAPTLSVMQQQYVEGARAIGAGRGRLIARHVLPNIAAPVIVQTTLSFSTAILSEATLSFLGLGTQPPHPSWGTMLSAGRRYMELAPWVAVYPGLAIALTVLGLNLLGDALRDALDPRLQQV